MKYPWVTPWTSLGCQLELQSWLESESMSEFKYFICFFFDQPAWLHAASSLSFTIITVSWIIQDTARVLSYQKLWIIQSFPCKVKHISTSHHFQVHDPELSLWSRHILTSHCFQVLLALPVDLDIQLEVPGCHWHSHHHDDFHQVSINIASRVALPLLSCLGLYVPIYKRADSNSSPPLFPTSKHFLPFGFLISYTYDATLVVHSLVLSSLGLYMLMVSWIIQDTVLSYQKL